MMREGLATLRFAGEKFMEVFLGKLIGKLWRIRNESYSCFSLGLEDSRQFWEEGADRKDLI